MTILTTWRCLDTVTRALKVVDEGLQVVGTFLKIPALLVATGLIMQHADDEIAVNIFATAGCVLEDTLSLS